MQITLLSHDDSDDDCKRTAYYVEHEGEQVYLAHAALGTYWTWQEIQERARNKFGDDVEIVFAPGTYCETEK